MEAQEDVSRKQAGQSDAGKAATQALQNEYRLQLGKYRWNTLGAGNPDPQPSLLPETEVVKTKVAAAAGLRSSDAPPAPENSPGPTSRRAALPSGRVELAQADDRRTTVKEARVAETKVADTRVEVSNGMVTAIGNGVHQLRFEYKRDGQTAAGEPIVTRMTGIINGQKVDLDGQNMKIRVAQRGDEAGNITVEHPDGKFKELINARDFTKETYQSLPNRDGGSDWRFVVAVKPDGPSGWDNGSKLFTKGDTAIEVREGLVCRADNGTSTLSCVYKRDGLGKPLLENGEAVVARIHGSVNGKPVDLNGDALTLRVVQAGEKIGDIHVFHADGKYKEVVRATDFAKHSYDHASGRIDQNDWRIRSIVKPDGPLGWESGSFRTIAYDDAHGNPTRPARIITANHTAADTLKVTMELKDKSANEYRTFTSDPNDKNIRDRTLAKFDTNSGEFSYSEAKYKWYEAPQKTDTADGGVKAARKELMRTLSEHGLVTDRTREYLDKFEGKSTGWVQRYRDKGWEAPSNQRIVATYRALSGLFEGSCLVSEKERDTYAMQQVAQLGEPSKNFQQRDVGTCAVVGELSAVLRVAPDELVGHCVEALKHGRITSTGIDRNGKHQKFEVDPRPYPDNRRYIDQLQQNMLTSMLGIKHTTQRYGGTYANETSYMYNFMTGRHDSFTAGQGTASEDVIKQLRHGNARLLCLGDSHIKDIEDARLLKDGTLEFFVHNWWSWENGTYGPGTGWYTPESLGFRPLRNVTPYLRDLGRK